MSVKPVLFNNTVLRDGHQSLAATRMKTSQMVDALADLEALNFHGLETWGGATIDSCLKFLGENPFERISTLKKGSPKTPHILLLRGQNIVQYANFPDDVVEAFVKCTADRGMDVFRVFDALNDIRNVKTAIAAVIKSGKEARGEICYTISPVHTIEAFVKYALELEELGCTSIGIKDMAGLIQPRFAYDLTKTLKTKLKASTKVILHSHDTAGLAASSYLAAIDAGVDVVETSIVPFANGTSQPDTLRMLALLEGHPRKPSYDAEKLRKLRKHFDKVYAELSKFTSPANERVDSDILEYQVPGGMLSNFLNQLKEQKMADKLPEVLKEITYVRECLGWIPLVTPTSQIVGTQAMFNVKMGRWNTIIDNAADIALGKYGKTPGPINPDVLKLVVEKKGQQPITSRMADSLAPGMDKLRTELKTKNLPVNDETAVLYAMFPRDVTNLYFPPAATPAPAAQPAAAPATSSNGVASLPGKGPLKKMALTVNAHRYDVSVQEV